jgi:hypothetical protein
MLKPKQLIAFITAFALAIALVGVGPQSAAAQNDEATETDGAVYTVAIHDGTCEEPSEEPTQVIGDARTYGLDDVGDEQAEENFRGAQEVVGVVYVESTIDMTFDELFEAGDQVIAVHPIGDMGTILACGAIGGIESEGRIAVGVASAVEDGVAGVVLFDQDQEGDLGIGDDQLFVQAYLVANRTGVTEGIATPEAVEENDVDAEEADADEPADDPSTPVAVDDENGNGNEDEA